MKICAKDFDKREGKMERKLREHLIADPMFRSNS